MHGKINLFVSLLTMAVLILGCGEPTPKEWQKARPVTGKLDHPQAFAVDEKFLYFITGGTVASRKEGTNNVLKMAHEGGEPVVLYRGGETIPNTDAIALDEKYLYFSAKGLQRIPKDGGEASQITEAFMASDLLVDGENVYWLPFVGEGMPPAPIFSVSKNGGEARRVTDPRPSANGLSMDDKFLYWIQTDGIYKVEKSGGTIEKIYTTPAGQISTRLKFDGKDLFFLEGESKRDLFRISRTGGDKQKIAKEVHDFWFGENDVIFERYIGSFDAGLFKIGKDGANETELDRYGHLADLIVFRNKIYLSDVGFIYALEK